MSQLAYLSFVRFMSLEEQTHTVREVNSYVYTGKECKVLLCAGVYFWCYQTHLKLSCELQKTEMWCSESDARMASMVLARVSE